MNAIHTIEDLMQVLDENPQWVEAMRVRLLTRELIELPEKFAQLVAKVDSLAAALNSLSARVDRIETRMDKIETDLGILKGVHARNVAIEEAAVIAKDMGFQWTKNLTRNEIVVLADRADTSGIPTNELRSFRRADLIMEVADRDGETCYIAAEISFTANGRDTTRALRNADFLTRFTGKNAYAAVVGLYRDDRIQADIESGKVFWYPLDPEVLEAE